MTQNVKTPARAFTLVELLIVLALILVLIGILLPVAGRIQRAAYQSRTRATLAQIAGACEKYYTDHRAYPGLFSNSAIYTTAGTLIILNVQPVPVNTGNRLTGTENAVVSLIGGMEPPATAPGFRTDEKTTIGKGPRGFSPVPDRSARTAPYLDARPGDLLPPLPYSENGCYANRPGIGVPTSVQPEKDGVFPEFYDAYAEVDRRPILILRANVGTPGIVTAAYGKVDQQYNRDELALYTRTATGDFPGDFVFGVGRDYPTLDAYLAHPSIAGIPRGKDKFLLISAGNDRAYGTADDLLYGGGQ